MRTNYLAAALLVLLTASPASAQWAVFDVANLAQAVSTVQQIQQQYAFMVAQAKSLTGIDGYRIGPLAAVPFQPRTVGAPVTMTPLPPMWHGALGAQDAALQADDTRLTQTLASAARVSAFSQALAGRLQRLEADVTAPGPHPMNTVLDAIAVGELLGRQQAAAANEVAQAQLDLQTADALQKREDTATLLRMRLEQLAAPSSQSGVDLLRTWRQP